MMPKSGELTSKHMKLLNDKGEPGCARSKIGGDGPDHVRPYAKGELPMRMKDRDERAKSMLTESRDGNEKPGQAIPNIEGVLSRCAENCKGGVESRCKKSNKSNKEPKRDNPYTNEDEPS